MLHTIVFLKVPSDEEVTEKLFKEDFCLPDTPDFSNPKLIVWTQPALSPNHDDFLYNVTNVGEMWWCGKITGRKVWIVFSLILSTDCQAQVINTIEHILSLSQSMGHLQMPFNHSCLIWKADLNVCYLLALEFWFLYSSKC